MKKCFLMFLMFVFLFVSSVIYAQSYSGTCNKCGASLAYGSKDDYNSHICQSNSGKGKGFNVTCSATDNSCYKSSCDVHDSH